MIVIISLLAGTWLAKGLSTTNGKLEERAQSHPPTLSQSRFLCHTSPHSAPVARRTSCPRLLHPLLFDFQLSLWSVIRLNLLWILVDLMDVIEFF